MFRLAGRCEFPLLLLEVHGGFFGVVWRSSPLHGCRFVIQAGRFVSYVEVRRLDLISSWPEAHLWI